MVIKNFNAWVYKIATNESFSHLRYIRRKKRDAIEEDLNGIINSLNINCNEDKNGKFIDFLALKQAMEFLKPVEREIIDLYYFDRLEYSEISEILDIKENTLRSMIHRILKKLEELMEK
jgi:RNA polymerase sigma factor (sigma-70 family)